MTESKWERETEEARSRAFEPLPEDAVRGAGAAPRFSGIQGEVRVPAREWRLRRAVELLSDAGSVGIGQAMLADLVHNPVDSPLWDDLQAVGASSALEERADRRGVMRKQRIWRIV